MIAPEWTVGMTPDEAKKFEELVRNSQTLFKRLRFILDKWEASQTRAERSIQIYDNPNWGYLQAHVNGDLYRIDKLRQLITIKEPKTNG